MFYFITRWAETQKATELSEITISLTTIWTVTNLCEVKGLKGKFSTTVAQLDNFSLVPPG